MSETPMVKHIKIGYHPDLMALGEVWPTYKDDETNDRCSYCEQRIYRELYGNNAVVVHLLHGHGYRMDAIRYDNENRVVGNAADAARLIGQ
jgi:hypothetical protein